MPNPVPPRGGVSLPVLVLAVLLAVAATAAAVLALRPAAPALATTTDPSGKVVAVPVASTEPFVQRDTVQPKRDRGGSVWYPVPFGSPPHLKLTCPTRDYVILTETEYGFTWAARAAADDFEPGTLDDPTLGGLMKAALLAGVPLSALDYGLGAKLKPGLTLPDFTWEAKGTAGKPGGRPTVEKGDFASLPNVEGEVAFGMTFAQPPNVTFVTDNTGGRTTITTITPTGFKWKNATQKDDDWRGRGSVTWQAKGMRAEHK